MLGLIIFLSIAIVLEGIILGEVIYMSKRPKFTLEIDDHDPDDIKLKLIAEDDDFKPGRIYFLKAVRRK